MQFRGSGRSGFDLVSGWRFITDFNERAFKLTCVSSGVHRYLMSRVVRVSIASWGLFNKEGGLGLEWCFVVILSGGVTFGVRFRVCDVPTAIR